MVQAAGADDDASGADPHLDPYGAQAGSRSRRRRQQPLSAALIVQTAVDWVEDVNLEALSMRRLGQALGVEAMSLYRYVPSREELLDAMVELLIDEVITDLDVSPCGTVPAGWQEYVRRLSCGIRLVALKYPHTFTMLAYRPPPAPWMRSPLRNLVWTEKLFEALMHDGFTDDAAASAYRDFGSFLLGQLASQAAASSPPTPSSAAALDSQRHPHPAATLPDFPLVERLRPKLLEDHSREEFDRSLADLLARIALLKE